MIETFISRFTAVISYDDETDACCLSLLSRLVDKREQSSDERSSQEGHDKCVLLLRLEWVVLSATNADSSSRGASLHLKFDHCRQLSFEDIQLIADDFQGQCDCSSVDMVDVCLESGACLCECFSGYVECLSSVAGFSAALAIELLQGHG